MKFSDCSWQNKHYEEQNKAQERTQQNEFFKFQKEEREFMHIILQSLDLELDNSRQISH